MLNPKSFTGKKKEYKFWKWDINNKFIWKLEKFNIDGYQIIYVINYLENKNLFIIKATVFIYFELYLNIIFVDL